MTDNYGSFVKFNDKFTLFMTIYILSFKIKTQKEAPFDKNRKALL